MSIISYAPMLYCIIKSTLCWYFLVLVMLKMVQFDGKKNSETFFCLFCLLLEARSVSFSVSFKRFKKKSPNECHANWNTYTHEHN